MHPEITIIDLGEDGDAFCAEGHYEPIQVFKDAVARHLVAQGLEEVVEDLAAATPEKIWARWTYVPERGEDRLERMGERADGARPFMLIRW